MRRMLPAATRECARRVRMLSPSLKDRSASPISSRSRRCALRSAAERTHVILRTRACRASRTLGSWNSELRRLISMVGEPLAGSTFHLCNSINLRLRDLATPHLATVPSTRRRQPYQRNVELNATMVGSRKTPTRMKAAHCERENEAVPVPLENDTTSREREYLEHDAVGPGQRQQGGTHASRTAVAGRHPVALAEARLSR